MGRGNVQTEMIIVATAAFFSGSKEYTSRPAAGTGWDCGGMGVVSISLAPVFLLLSFWFCECYLRWSEGAGFCVWTLS